MQENYGADGSPDRTAGPSTGRREDGSDSGLRPRRRTVLGAMVAPVFTVDRTTTDEVGGRSGTGESAPAPNDWAMYQADPANRGAIEPGRTPKGVSVRWHKSSFENRWGPGTVTVADDTVYLTYDQGLHAFDVEDGSKRWPSPFQPERSGLFSTPAVAGDQVFFATHHLHAVDADDGTQQWRFVTGGVTSPPTVDGDTVFVTAGDNAYGISRDGSIRWMSDFPDTLLDRRAPPVVDGRVFVHGDGTTYALDRADGSLLWRAEIGGLGSALSVVNDTVFAFTSGDEVGVVSLYALDADDGSVRWRRNIDLPAGTPTLSRITLANGRLHFTIVGRGVGDDGDWPFGLYALDAETGDRLWVNESIRIIEFPTTLVAVEDLLFTGDVIGTLWAVDSATGEIRWEDTVGGRRVNPVATGDSLYVRANPNEAQDEGEFYALDFDFDSEPPTNQLRVAKEGQPEGLVVFAVWVDGDVSPTETFEGLIEGSSALDWLGPQRGVDALEYSGEITRFLLDGAANVYVNGDQVHPDEVGNERPPEDSGGPPENTLRVAKEDEPDGRVMFAVAVDGALAAGEGFDGVLEGTYALDWLGPKRGVDALEYSGEITTFLFHGDANVYVNGEEVDPDDLGD